MWRTSRCGCGISVEQQLPGPERDRRPAEEVDGEHAQRELADLPSRVVASGEDTAPGRSSRDSASRRSRSRSRCRSAGSLGRILPGCPIRAGKSDEWVLSDHREGAREGRSLRRSAARRPRHRRRAARRSGTTSAPPSAFRTRSAAARPAPRPGARPIRRAAAARRRAPARRRSARTRTEAVAPSTGRAITSALRSSWRRRCVSTFGAIPSTCSWSSPNRRGPSSSAATISSVQRSPTVASASASADRARFRRRPSSARIVRDAIVGAARLVS